MTMKLPGATDELHDDAHDSVVRAITALVPDEHVPVNAALSEFVNLDASPAVAVLHPSTDATESRSKKTGRRAALVGTALGVKLAMGVTAAAALGVGVEIADIAEVPVIHEVVQVLGVERVVEEKPADELDPVEVDTSTGAERPGSSPDAGQPESPGNSGNAGQPESPGNSGNAGQPESPGNSGSAGQPDGPGNSSSAGPPESPGNSGNAGQPESPGNSGDAGQPDEPGNANGQGPPEHANGKKKP